MPELVLVPELVLLAAAGDAPPAVDPNDVTPGLGGFLALFFLALAVILLSISMVRRVRRIRYRAEVERREEAARAAREGPSAPPPAAPPGPRPGERPPH